MKKYIYFLPLILAIACAEKSEHHEEKEVHEEKHQETMAAKPDSVLRHNVFFSFKETSSQEDIQSVIDAFRNLQNEIDGIEAFEYGVNSSPEGLNQGLTHAFVLTFHSDAARDAYLPHPAHAAFGAILGPHLDKVTVVDYWSRP
ncbi:Dabb family protein [Algoriphagus aquimarinus]|uniref:Stress responsive A/B Barrel Domain n=1 Tax=Algoriphagus aquimarinus TaxID=237018 RepID=A0A1I1CDT1_9BACT|nr:Dabb family protein [Algoriphagus aquimarinus]SFB59028.1 Stress responsive A/B Barrel Domain [Algoriphagus aquimarinus]|tara:strand:+ start:16237 stop:16668 length:432 start_codon:yes stop_codon:yes gene_type:complete